MWVFVIVFLLSRLFRLAGKVRALTQEQENSQGVTQAGQDGNRLVKYEDENDFETQELKRLQIEGQKIKNVIAEEKLALDRQKRIQSKAIHEFKLKKVAKEFTNELKEPLAWFS